MQRSIRPLAIGLGLLLASACARSSADKAPPAEPATATVERGSSVTGVFLAPEIQQACDVTSANAFFEFDSSEMDHTDDASLWRVAECFTTGPLKGRKLILVGHTDPRGSEEHNFQLGKTRAESVQVYLAGEGVELGNITTLTEGELEANPAVPAEWSFDRRVDIRLASE